MCGGPNNKNCWQYDVTSNSWSSYTTSKYTHNYQTAVTYNNKLYIVDDAFPEIFDPTTKVGVLKLFCIATLSKHFLNFRDPKMLKTATNLR